MPSTQNCFMTTDVLQQNGLCFSTATSYDLFYPLVESKSIQFPPMIVYVVCNYWSNQTPHQKNPFDDLKVDGFQSSSNISELHGKTQYFLVYLDLNVDSDGGPQDTYL